MSMQVKPVKNPWETSFENLTTKVHKSIKKAASDATKTIVADVKQQVVGEQAMQTQQAMQAPQSFREIKEQVKPEEKKKLELWRRNLADLEAQIKKAREERLKREQESGRVKEQEKQQKKVVEEKKKKEEPVWKKMMKMGSQAERKVNAGG